MFYSLFQALFSSIRDDEAKPRQVSSANPPVNQRVKSASPPKASQVDLDGDIHRLEETFGNSLEQGCCIEVSIQELLKICPRSRRRSDAFKTLIRSLAEQGVTLNIKRK